MSKESRFFTFPVELLRGAFVDIGGVCYNATAYAVYVRCKDYDETPDDAFEFFGFDSGGRSVLYHNHGRELFDSFERPPLVSVNKEIIVDFWSNPKTDFEIAVFCAFCGLRSIIGTKPYANSTNGYLLARMFGYRSEAEFDALREKPTYYAVYFSTAQKIRYRLTEKIIKNELSLSWGLKYYSYQMTGFYASFVLEFEALVSHAEKRRKSILLKKKVREQKEVIGRVRQQIRGM